MSVRDRTNQEALPYEIQVSEENHSVNNTIPLLGKTSRGVQRRFICNYLFVAWRAVQEVFRGITVCNDQVHNLLLFSSILTKLFYLPYFGTACSIGRVFWLLEYPGHPDVRYMK